MIDRFGREITWDFQRLLNVDINDFFEGKRYWSEFYLFFEELPASSKTKARISMDEEMAQMRIAGYSEEELRKILNARAEGQKDIELNPEDYDIVVEKLNQVIDSVNSLALTVRAGFGGKVSDSDFKPVKRPKTPFEKFLDDRLMQIDKQDNDELASDFGF